MLTHVLFSHRAMQKSNVDSFRCDAHGTRRISKAPFTLAEIVAGNVVSTDGRHHVAKTLQMSKQFRVCDWTYNVLMIH